MHIEVTGGVRTVTIDIAPLNLVGAAFIGELLQVLAELERDPDVRVVVFRSADPDFFLMHGDVEAILAAGTPAHAAPVTQPNIAAATFERVRRAPYLSIGAIDGAARGGGCEFLSALDLRIGTPRTRIGQPEGAMGILPGAGGSVRWPRVVGRARALELILTGRDLDADEALALGWLQAVVPSDELEAHVASLADRISRLPGSVIAEVKRVVDATLAESGDALAVESDALARLMAEGHQQRQMRQFLDHGGQTREGERGDLAPLVDRMLGLAD